MPAMAAASKVKLKVLIEKNANKVLFAEGGKDFVDFLFYLLLLPVGNVIRLLHERGEVGSLSDLHRSIQNLCETYMQPGVNKDLVLNPGASTCAGANKIPLMLSDHESNTRKVYSCPVYYHFLSDVPGLVCPRCKCWMSREVPYVAPASASSGSVAEGGFVKGVVTYMVMDNVEIKPMSTISSITLLNKFNVKDVSSLEETVVVLDMNKGLKLLSASLECKNVLTSVFLVYTGERKEAQPDC